MTSAKSMLASLGISKDTVVTLPTEESERQAAREMRRANCGQFSVRIDPMTGGWKRHKHTCRLWRDRFCQRCYDDRKDKVIGTLMQIDEDCATAVAVRMTSSEAKAHTRAMRDKGIKYKRYPTESGDEIVIFDHDEYEFYGDTMATGEIDLDELTATPLRKRVSGHLGDAPAPIIEDEDEGEKITVKVTSIIATAGEGHVLSDAWKVAMEKTRGLDPEFDVEFIQWACWKRMSAYREAIIEMGGTIHYVCRMNETVSFNSYKGWEYNELEDEKLDDMDSLWMRGAPLGDNVAS